MPRQRGVDLQTPLPLMKRVCSATKEAKAQLPAPNLTKLVRQQNCPSQAEPLPQYTQAAATTTTPPAGQQYRAASPPGWAAAETPPTLAGLHVPAQTTASLPITDGRHGVRDECQLHRPPQCSIFGRGSAPSSPSHRSILCLPERNVFEVDPGEAVHAHALDQIYFPKKPG